MADDWRRPLFYPGTPEPWTLTRLEAQRAVREVWRPASDWDAGAARLAWGRPGATGEYLQHHLWNEQVIILGGHGLDMARLDDLLEHGVHDRGLFLEFTVRPPADTQKTAWVIDPGARVLDTTTCRAEQRWLGRPPFWEGVMAWALARRPDRADGRWPVAGHDEEWAIDAKFNREERLLPFIIGQAMSTGIQVLITGLAGRCLVLDPGVLALDDPDRTSGYDWYTHTRDWYARAVAWALARGLPVPDRVLADLQLFAPDGWKVAGRSPETKGAAGRRLVTSQMIDERMAAVHQALGLVRRLVVDLRQRERTARQDLELDLLSVRACMKLLAAVVDHGYLANVRSSTHERILGCLRMPGVSGRRRPVRAGREGWPDALVDLAETGRRDPLPVLAGIGKMIPDWSDQMLDESVTVYEKLQGQRELGARIGGLMEAVGWPELRLALEPGR